MALAVKHFAEARQSPEKYAQVSWFDVEARDAEIEKTRIM
jgi:hypothetical protein